MKRSKLTIHPFFICVFTFFIPIISFAQKKDNPKSALKKQPNIIFIVTDDQHRNQFNFLKEGQDENGNPTNLTPNMDRLVGEGVIFDESYVSTSVCTPVETVYLQEIMPVDELKNQILKDIRGRLM